MANGTSSEVLEWKNRYESSEQCLQTLKKLSHKAITDYEELQRKYDQNQKAYDELKTRLQDTEYQLQGLQRALEPACEEYKNLQDLYSIEQGCRSEAEKYASSVTKQNKKLKRQSQMLLTNLTTHNISLDTLDEISLAEGDVPVEDSRADELQKKVSQLEDHNMALGERIGGLEEGRSRAAETEIVLTRQVEQYQDALATAHETILEHERTITNYAKISESACLEHQELMSRYEQERGLREAAEAIATDMSSQRDAIVRESTVLLATAAADQKLMEAFLQIEDLQKELGTVKETTQRKIRDLEDTIENDLSAQLVEDLETRLEIATQEITSQQAKIKDLEKWKDKLTKDYERIEMELDVTKQRLPTVPPAPPPPPPPPASLFTVFRPFKRNKDKSKGDGSGSKQKQDDSKNPAFGKALEEMMDRIKTGSALKPMAQRREYPRKPSLPDYQSKSKASAMDELNLLLKKVKRSSDDLDLPSSRSTRPPPEGPSAGGQSELALISQRIRTGAAANLSRISEEDTSAGSVNGEEASASVDKRASTNL